MLLSWSNHIKSVYQIISMLPVNASVSAQYQIAPHIVRPYGKILPAPHLHEDSDYVILDLHIPLALTTVENFKEYFIALTNNKQYKLIYGTDNVFVFKKL